jgi:hypothetical protein
MSCMSLFRYVLSKEVVLVSAIAASSLYPGGVLARARSRPQPFSDTIVLYMSTDSLN